MSSALVCELWQTSFVAIQIPDAHLYVLPHDTPTNSCIFYLELKDMHSSFHHSSRMKYVHIRLRYYVYVCIGDAIKILAFRCNVHPANLSNMYNSQYQYKNCIEKLVPEEREKSWAAHQISSHIPDPELQIF